MGLIIKKELTSSQGLTIPPGTYMGVHDFIYSKADEVLRIIVKTYVSQEAKEQGFEPYQIANFVGNIPYHVPMEALEGGQIYAIIYNELKTDLSNHFGEGTIEDAI